MILHDWSSSHLFSFSFFPSFFFPHRNHDHANCITNAYFTSFSDDDEFYDRTKKPSVQKAGENLSVETADTLLDKRDAIMKQMEEKKEVLLIEKSKMASETAVENVAGDALDTYMSGLSSQLGRV